jgi:hypothetical protein
MNLPDGSVRAAAAWPLRESEVLSEPLITERADLPAESDQPPRLGREFLQRIQRSEHDFAVPGYFPRTQRTDRCHVGSCHERGRPDNARSLRLSCPIFPEHHVEYHITGSGPPEEAARACAHHGE